MQVFSSFEEFAEQGKAIAGSRPVVTVGSFDGVHLGHQYLLAELIEWARREQAKALVVTFASHPREFMTGRSVPALTTPEHKVKLLREAGVDVVLMPVFDDSLRNRTAEEFLREVLVNQLHARCLLVGHNNRIGRNGEGTFSVLARIGRRLGMEVREAECVEVSGEAMSSSSIRKHVANGDFLWARKMLGRPYSILAVVQRGDARGRTIGFPTMNFSLEGLAAPPTGVYGVRVVLQGQRRIAAANIGTRPTVHPEASAPLLEVHVPGFAGDVYGREVEVEFLFRVRDERKFAGIDVLKEQLARDVEEIRRRAREDGLLEDSE